MLFRSLILEAMAQAAGILIFKTTDSLPDEKSVYYYAGIDHARFKRPVIPGDQLEIEVAIEFVGDAAGRTAEIDYAMIKELHPSLSRNHLIAMNGAVDITEVKGLVFVKRRIEAEFTAVVSLNKDSASIHEYVPAVETVVACLQVEYRINR